MMNCKYVGGERLKYRGRYERCYENGKAHSLHKSNQIKHIFSSIFNHFIGEAHVDFSLFQNANATCDCETKSFITNINQS